VVYRLQNSQKTLKWLPQATHNLSRHVSGCLKDNTECVKHHVRAHAM